MVSWPFTDSVISPIQGTLVVTPRSGVIETQMDVGPTKQRVRSSIMRENLTFQMILNDSQKATLRTFYRTTTKFGTIRFDWTHPETNVAYTAAFRLLMPPTFTNITGGPAVTTGGLWHANIMLEWIG